MTTRNKIYVKALFSRDFPLMMVVPGTSSRHRGPSSLVIRLSRSITSKILPASFPVAFQRIIIIIIIIIIITIMYV